MKVGKVSRVLGLYSQLLDSQTIKKAAAVQQYGVNERSIQRDIEDIRAFCHDGMTVGNGTPCDIVYDYVDKGYRMEYVDNVTTGKTSKCGRGAGKNTSKRLKSLKCNHLKFELIFRDL